VGWAETGAAGVVVVEDRSAAAAFLCLRAELLARDGAAPEDTTGSEPEFLLLAIEKLLSLNFRTYASILSDFSADAEESFYQFHHNFRGREVSDMHVHVEV
jgi:hypothetical protein